MQMIARVQIGPKTYPVLVRSARHGVTLKLARGSAPADAPFLDEETSYLAATPRKAEALLRGEVVKC